MIKNIVKSRWKCMQPNVPQNKEGEDLPLMNKVLNLAKEKGFDMDHLTKYLVYNRTPKSRDNLDYEAIKKQNKDQEKGTFDKRLLLLSPEFGRKDEGFWYIQSDETRLPVFVIMTTLHISILRLVFYRCKPRHPNADVVIYQAVNTFRTCMNKRVLYPRNKLSPGAKPSVVGGKPITEEQAIELRITTFGTAACPPRAEWVRSPIVMRAPDQPLGYGLAAPRNGARSLLAGLQAHIIKWLLFDSRPLTKDNKSMEHPETYLRPSEERQDEALWRACSEVIWRCAGGFNLPQGGEATAIVALPSETTYVQHSSYYYQDTITEKFKTEEGCGALLLLYAAVLSRGCDNVKKDLDGKQTYLVSSHVEGSLNVVTLLLTGRATPYLHNGVVYIGDEDHYAMPQFGVLSRSPVGLLVWYGSEDNAKNNANQQHPGSRLKTPSLPIWVTSCSGHYGVLFNTNRELLRNYHAERRFDIQYYTCGGCHVLLNVDTRSHEAAVPARGDDISATPLEKLIHTKWQDAKITWTGPGPNTSDAAN